MGTGATRLGEGRVLWMDFGSMGNGWPIQPLPR
jgi:hypothetical protein